MQTRLIIVITIIVLAAAPSFAQSARGFVTGAGGFAVSPDTTSGDWLGEAGVRVAPNLFVFGDLGQFHNLQPSQVQPAIDTTTAMVSQSGLTVVGSGRVPATYGLGGLRFEVPTRSRFAPYVFGGVGMAHVAPTATFTYTSGPLPDSSTPRSATTSQHSSKRRATSASRQPRTKPCTHSAEASRFPWRVTGPSMPGIASRVSPRTRRCTRRA